MLMIILGILKVIGILFLILLGIILLLILLLLFCPVRYAGAAKKAEGRQLRASGDITWLLHLFHVHVTVEGTQPEVTVRILGVSPEGFGRFVSVFRRKPKPSKDVFEREKECSSKSASEVIKHDEKCFAEGETVTDHNKKPDESDKKEFSDKKDKENIDENSNTQNNKASVFDKLYSIAERIIKQIIAAGRKILGILKKIFHLPERIAIGINKGLSQGKAVAKNVSDLKEFVSTQEFKEAMTFGLGRVMRFLHHLRPKKLTGYVEFGFSDPADTGMALAVMAPFFPYYADHLQVVPDFQEKKLSFSLSFKGRIYGCMLLYLAVQILLDRNIRIIIGKIRKRRSE